MQISRLFQIVYYLMEQKAITAKELAEKLEVSSRTIYRDIETLSESGVPIFATQGKGGGIRLAEGYVLDRTLLTAGEQKEILASLQSLNAMGISEGAEKALKKLSSLFGGKDPSWLKIDLSDWSNRRQADYELVKDAIIHHKVIAFDYYGSNGVMTSRKAEPVQLWFKSSTWYLRAFCLERRAMRTFKMSRIKRLQALDETFVSKRDTEEEEKTQPVSIGHFTMWIDQSQAYRVYDCFEEEEITRLEDGNFLVRTAYPIDDWFYGSILSYGVHGKIIDPPELKEKIEAVLQKMLENYKE